MTPEETMQQKPPGIVVGDSGPHPIPAPSPQNVSGGESKQIGVRLIGEPSAATVRWNWVKKEVQAPTKGSLCEDTETVRLYPHCQAGRPASAAGSLGSQDANTYVQGTSWAPVPKRHVLLNELSQPVVQLW